MRLRGRLPVRDKDNIIGFFYTRYFIDPKNGFVLHCENGKSPERKKRVRNLYLYFF